VGIVMDADRWKRVDDLLQSVLEVPDTQQEEFLRQACAGDGKLLAEVQSLLSSHRKLGGFLEEPALAVGSNLSTQPEVHAIDDPLLDQTMSHYRVLRRLGVGGMGMVYEAEDLRLGRHVALKLLLDSKSANTKELLRFQQEARAISTLNHPHICTLYEVEEHEGKPVIVMELLQGETLKQRLKAGCVPLRQVLQWGTEVADALEAAHAAGLLHRDIKPANIFIGQRGSAKVLDFGLAKLSPRARGTASTAEEPLTSIGVIAGTTPYMSPEQVRGENLDGRTDVFSLGVVLYEMATANQPFAERNIALTMDAVLHRQPPSPRTLNPELPPELERIIEKALAKERDLRYQSAAALGTDLEKLRHDTDTGVVRPAHSDRVPATNSRRRRTWVAAGALLVLIAAVLGIFIARIARRRVVEAPVEKAMVEGRRSVAVLGFRNLSGNPEQEWVSTAVSEILSTELASGDKLRVVAGENVAHMKSDLSLPVTDSYAPETLAKIRGNLGADDVVVGSYLALGKGTRTPLHINFRVQDASGGETIAAIAESGSETELAELVSRASSTLRTKLGMGLIPQEEAQRVGASLPSNPEAVRFYSEGLAKWRAFDAKAARELLEKAVANDPNHALSHSYLAQSLFSLGYEEKAKTEARRAADLSQNLPRRDQLLVEARYRELQNDYPAAIEAYRTLCKLFPDDLDSGLGLAAAQVKAGQAKDSLATLAQLRKLPPPRNQDPRIDLAESEANESLGNFQSAQQEASSAAELASRQGSRLVMAAAKAQEARVWERLGEFDKAGVEYAEVRKLSLESGNPASAAGALIGGANVLYDKGDFEGALKSFQQAFAIVRQIGAERMIAVVVTDMGNVFADRGNLSEARRYYLEALDIDRALGSKDVASDFGNLANIIRSMGDLPGAVRMQEQSLEASRQQGDRLGEGETLTDMGYVLFDQGQLAAAEARFAEGKAVLEQIGFRRGRGFTAFGISEVRLAQDRLTEARAKTEEAIALFNELGDTSHLAEGQVQLARILLEQANAPEAAKVAQDVAAEIEKQNMSDLGCGAQAVLSKAFLAQAAATRATDLCRLGSDRTSQFEAQFALAAVRSRTGKFNDAFKILEAVRSEASRYGYGGYVLESRLRLGELELSSGKLSSGRSHLQQLEADARSHGFLLIARKSAQAVALNSASGTFKLGLGEYERPRAAAGEDVEHPEGFLEIRHSPPRSFLSSRRADDSGISADMQ
jgi:eukaryotic-like serine/threonine-protein kinase